MVLNLSPFVLYKDAKFLKIYLQDKNFAHDIFRIAIVRSIK